MKISRSPAHRTIQLVKKPIKIAGKTENKQNINPQLSLQPTSNLSKTKDSLNKIIVKKKYTITPTHSNNLIKQTFFMSTLINQLNVIQKSKSNSIKDLRSLINIMLSDMECSNNIQQQFIQTLKRAMLSLLSKGQLNDKLCYSKNIQDQKNIEKIDLKKISSSIKNNINQDDNISQVEDSDLSRSSSLSCYLVDPQIPVPLKPLSPDLAKQLQLNFIKIPQLRKRDLL